jgi:hypothetical protein
MYLAIDIEQKAKPIIHFSWKSRVVRFMHGLLERFRADLLSELNSFIATMEGVLLHLQEIPVSEIQPLRKKVLKLITSFDTLDAFFKEIDYMESKEVQEKFRYSQQLLYRMEAKLDVKVHRESPDKKTPAEFKGAFAQLSHEAITHALTSN